MWTYLFSLPERLIRALAALLGGLAHRVLELVLPGWARSSRLYQATVDRMLRIIVELVGGVSGVFAADDVPVSELAARKAAGNVIEVISFAVTGLSPVWLLAVASDLSGGTRLYLQTLVEDLKQEGALPAEAEIASVEDLLGVLERFSGQGADIVDMPPLNVREMRESWEGLRAGAAELPGPEQLARIYADLQHIAKQEGRTLRETSSLIAVSAMHAGLKMGSVYMFDYYRDALSAIKGEGLWRYLRRSMHPYLRMVIYHLHPDNPSYTERGIQSQPVQQAAATTRRAWRTARHLPKEDVQPD